MTFNAALETTNDIAKITLSGELDASTAPLFKEKVEEAAKHNITHLVLFMSELQYMSSAGLRILIFAKQKMGAKVDIYIIGAQEMVKDTIEHTGFHYSVIMLEAYEPVQINN